MAVWQKIRDAQTVLSLFFVTIFVVPFQFLLLFGLIVTSENPQTYTPNILLINLPYLIAYIILTIVYSIVTSFLFRPKRIVSPINIQIATGIVLGIVAFLEIRSASSPLTMETTLSLFGRVAFNIFLLTTVLTSLGFAQLFLVRFLAGLNFMGIDRKSYLIDADVETVDKLLKSFLPSRNYKRGTRLENQIMYKKPRLASEQVILLIGLNPQNKNNTILATAAFHKGYYNVEISQQSIDFRDSAIKELTGWLLTNNPSLEIWDKDNLEDPVSAGAYAEAYDPTTSKIPKIESIETVLEKIPLSFRVMISVTFIALLGVNVSYWAHYGGLTFDTYVITTVGLLISLFVEIGIPLREELKLKREKQTD
jgi:hypothetical protein